MDKMQRKTCERFNPGFSTQESTTLDETVKNRAVHRILRYTLPSHSISRCAQLVLCPNRIVQQPMASPAPAAGDKKDSKTTIKVKPVRRALLRPSLRPAFHISLCSLLPRAVGNFTVCVDAGSQRCVSLWLYRLMTVRSSFCLGLVVLKQPKPQ